MAAAAKLHFDYPRLADIRRHPATGWRDVLAIVHYAHEGEPAALPLADIRALLAAANARLGIERFALEHLSYKVYVRHAEHLPPIEQELRRAIGPAARRLYLKADICRRDLLVEIEASGS